MEVEHVEKEKISIFKKLERYLSKKRRSPKSTTTTTTTGRSIFTKSKSWHSSTKERQKAGCFSVCVGAEKQRFLIKTEFANHPLFKMLLEDAELEYGFKNEGPLVLPCEVDLFYKVLAEMDCGQELGHGSCSPFSPARRLGRSDMAKGCSSYGLLTPPPLLKINHF